MKEIVVEVTRAVCLLVVLMIFVDGRYEKKVSAISDSEYSNVLFFRMASPHPAYSNADPPDLPPPSPSQYLPDNPKKMSTDILNKDDFIPNRPLNMKLPNLPVLHGHMENARHIKPDSLSTNEVITLQNSWNFTEYEGVQGITSTFPFIVAVIPGFTLPAGLLTPYASCLCR